MMYGRWKKRRIILLTWLPFLVSSPKKFAVVRKRDSFAGVLSVNGVFSIEHALSKRAGKEGRAKRDAPRETPPRTWEKRRKTAKRENRSRSRANIRIRGSIGLIIIINEFHITIGVVKLRMVRVDPGSWVVHVQHGVRLASALRAVAQG